MANDAVVSSQPKLDQETQSHDPKSLQRNPKFWLDGGSVILRIGNDAFKVHRTLLYRHSLALPSWPVDPGTELSEGCGVVSIPPHHDISAADVEALLEYLYHDKPLSADSPFPHVASVFRTTSKRQLDLPSVHAIARERLESMFPSGPQPFSHPDNLEDALELALEYQISSIQKGLFYSLVTTATLHEEEEETSAFAHLQDPTTQSEVPDPTNHLDQKLSPAVRQRASQLMHSIMGHFTPILFTVATAEHMECTDIFADAWMPLVIQPALESDGVYKPLETLQNIINVDWEAQGLCQSCTRLKREEWRAEQEDIWNRVDEWLELKPTEAPDKS
ncbi:hypothetical protein JAAARDRAFT_124279 [Jaapia argillacea MUCL 33604]|uniref:BTB domain-containing protein n=1 Tax=Jaapia argillacea MUCL 33604 TaxID=933084 RepID=A0A067QF89_9AGAM|nr:hypothetical protein JAAARDRAFT_124279 [Jaapia argillacea MUCL 33604]